MLCIVLAEAALEKFGGDSMSEFLLNFDGYIGVIQDRGYVSV